ncbi:hypothetical protein HK102_008995, partial [Quaeritorhiza haematococci]
VTSPSSSNAPWTDVRLPSWIRPITYTLDFVTDVEKFKFYGSVSIHVNVTETSPILVLHAADLDLADLRVVPLSAGDDQVIVPIANTTNDQEQVVFSFEPKLAVGEYTVILKYAGILTDSLHGYYKSRFISKVDGKKKYIATTQFESSDARRAFPCFDEPAMKATFIITMTVPQGYHALSNMPTTDVQSVEPPTAIAHSIDSSSTWRKFSFTETKRMSTYLVAFIVSNFESIEGYASNGRIRVGVWTQPGRTELGRYALDVAIKILEFYEKRFQVEYPLPKSDLIAIPDFAAGAMENWGLITYRDTALLYDSTLSSAVNKQRVATVIAHELAHQWFGNLVTMAWWNDLWLNEGFAEFMEYKGTNAAEPSWQMPAQFIYMDLLSATFSDASVFTHPIAADVHNPNEIDEIFDDISYAKGSSVL